LPNQPEQAIVPAGFFFRQGRRAAASGRVVPLGRPDGAARRPYHPAARQRRPAVPVRQGCFYSP